MQRWTNEVIVGLSILVAIVILVFGYIYLREIPVRRQGFEVNVLFDNVTGLELGDKVSISGLNVGRVQNLQLLRNKNKVNVRIWLSGKIPYPNDSRAAIRSIGMIGEKYVDLMLGSSPVGLQEGDTIPGLYIDDLADAGGSVKNLMERSNTLLAKLNTVLDTSIARQAQASLSETLQNIEGITGLVEARLQKNMGHFERGVASLDTLATDLARVVHHNRSGLDSTLTHLSAGAAKLPGIAVQLDSMLTTTRALLAIVENQEGTVGRVLRDDTLYWKANNTVDRLQALLEDIKKHPQRYLRISVIDLF